MPKIFTNRRFNSDVKVYFSHQFDFSIGGSKLQRRVSIHRFFKPCFLYFILSCFGNSNRKHIHSKSQVFSLETLAYLYFYYRLLNHEVPLSRVIKTLYTVLKLKCYFRIALVNPELKWLLFVNLKIFFWKVTRNYRLLIPF